MTDKIDFIQERITGKSLVWGFEHTRTYMKLPDTHHFQSRYFISIETEDSEEVTSMSLSSQSARQTGPVNLEISQSDLGK